MATPSPAALRACAQQLRELAATQRSNAGACQTLLDAVTNLDSAQTWQGSYPDTAHRRFTDWRSGQHRRRAAPRRQLLARTRRRVRAAGRHRRREHAMTHAVKRAVIAS